MRDLDSTAIPAFERELSARVLKLRLYLGDDSMDGLGELLQFVQDMIGEVILTANVLKRFLIGMCVSKGEGRVVRNAKCEFA